MGLDLLVLACSHGIGKSYLVEHPPYPFNINYSFEEIESTMEEYASKSWPNNYVDRIMKKTDDDSADPIPNFVITDINIPVISTMLDKNLPCLVPVLRKSDPCTKSIQKICDNHPNFVFGVIIDSDKYLSEYLDVIHSTYKGYSEEIRWIILK